MKKIPFISTLIVVLFLSNACRKTTAEIENDFLAGLKLDFSSLQIDFELLFEYENKKQLLEKAEEIYPSLLKDAREFIHEKDKVSHFLLTFQISQGKAKLREIMMYDVVDTLVTEYHDYTRKLGTVDGLSADADLLNLAYHAVTPKNFSQIEQLKSQENNLEQASAFTDFLDSQYKTPSDTLDLILLISMNDVQGYSKSR